MVATIFGGTLIALGISLIISSFLIFSKRGIYMFIMGFIIGIIGLAIYPKNPPTPIELKSKKVVNIDSIYARGFRDGYNECKNK